MSKRSCPGCFLASPPPKVPKGDALADMVIAHHEDALSFYGVPLGLKVIRKHLGWYMDAAQTPAGLRKAVLTAKAPAQIHGLLRQALTGAETVAA